MLPSPCRRGGVRIGRSAKSVQTDDAPPETPIPGLGAMAASGFSFGRLVLIGTEAAAHATYPGQTARWSLCLHPPEDVGLLRKVGAPHPGVDLVREEVVNGCHSGRQAILRLQLRCQGLLSQYENDADFLRKFRAGLVEVLSPDAQRGADHRQPEVVLGILRTAISLKCDADPVVKALVIWWWLWSAAPASRSFNH